MRRHFTFGANQPQHQLTGTARDADTVDGSRNHLVVIFVAFIAEWAQGAPAIEASFRTAGRDETVIAARTAFRTFCRMPNEHPKVWAATDIDESARGDHPVDVDLRTALAELLDTTTASQHSQPSSRPRRNASTTLKSSQQAADKSLLCPRPSAAPKSRSRRLGRRPQAT